jgi:hypothetical protein
MRTILLAAVTMLASCAAGPDDDPDDAGDDAPDDPPDDPPEEPPAPPTPAEAAERALAVWLDCMRLADYQAANMAPAWAGLPSTPGGTCQSCHANGLAAFIANPDAPTSFAVIQSQRPFALTLFSVDLSGGVYQARVVVNEALLGAVGAAAPPHAEHPRFDAVNGAGMVALRQFHALTAQGLASGRCEPAQ